MTKAIPPKSLVLYADDDADDHMLVRDAFEDFESVIDLVPFDNGSELLNYLKDLQPFQPHPCLIILDVNMPVMDGKQTLRRIRQMQQFANTQVVLFTTSTMPAEMAFAAEYNAGFVTKPLHFQHMDLLVDQFIEHCSPQMRDRVQRHRRQ